jgi:Ca2+-binding EF-hand superfamily protein
MEFLSATVDRKNLLSKKKLQIVFSSFDKDDDGFISPKDIKLLLNNS